MWKSIIYTILNLFDLTFSDVLFNQQEKQDHVGNLPAQSRRDSGASHNSGRDSGTGDSMPSDAYHGVHHQPHRGQDYQPEMYPAGYQPHLYQQQPQSAGYQGHPEGNLI